MKNSQFGRKVQKSTLLKTEESNDEIGLYLEIVIFLKNTWFSVEVVITMGKNVIALKVLNKINVIKNAICFTLKANVIYLYSSLFTFSSKLPNFF